MEIVVCQQCKSILMVIDGTLSVDIPLPGRAIETTVKCNKCKEKTIYNIINRLQGTMVGWPSEDRLLIDWGEVKFKPRE